LGKIHVYTGEGKGKTTAAFGLAIRASGNGFKVLIIQFLKKGEQIGEVVSCKRLPGVTVEQYGTGRFVHEESITEEDRGLATGAMERAVKAASSRETDLLILDELNIAVHFGLVSVEKVIRLIDSKPKDMELVITGRYAKDEVIARADYVTEMCAIKHPYFLGEEGRKGIEF